MGFLDSILNNAKNSINNSINHAVNKTVNDAKRNAENKATAAVQNAMTHKTKTFTYNAIPNNLEELKALKEADMKDPFGVVALTILAFNTLASNREAGIEMLEYLNGPADVSTKDKQFINDRFMDGRDYIPKSYFKGAVPTNNYTPNTPYTIDVEELAHSRDTINEGYLRLFVRSGGADTERYVVLRTKPSTGEWFLWDFSGIMASIRIPTAQDAWA